MLGARHIEEFIYQYFDTVRMNCYASETKWLPYNPPNVSLSYRKRSCSIVNTY